ncbi:hypothetical protein LP43_2062 [Methylophaga thiooxydans]|uniref:Uncharacterized protein n=2 Tax=Methylophaga thiooxydans TaxID=392484 RepID=C0N9B6_9GAMM|nr:hypothetical protein [Methylophaga thiooxydans]EEF78624.1 hypothetical protein MDMS009_2797 [Methylophaga thiooxydans DMS010]KGM06189.1 hypothetical protein LP43_2062 [Methylophaga thiooxydans]|eukprot:CAMPEP_0184467580 /NCGR_PEP_ID=MMETSP0740-20130409/73125_1 /TAXON_ID=385413 /ORGANISM="Thalassiosira miniscula, Strain CCMP1093" /LENGTH=102 /DNA_ID=CAMNT_0026842937 /DNA_START=30 /DNA_END=338 /DNA_ORIENTATION=-
MKYLVKLVQLGIVLVILYPIYYVWDTDRIDNFCEGIKPAMSVEALNALAERHGLTLNAPEDLTSAGGLWITSVESHASFSGYACVIKGAANRVAVAQVIKTE